MLLLLMAGGAAAEPEPEPTTGGSDFLNRLAALRFVEQSRARPKPEYPKPPSDDFWWWD